MKLRLRSILKNRAAGTIILHSSTYTGRIISYVQYAEKFFTAELLEDAAASIVKTVKNDLIPNLIDV